MRREEQTEKARVEQVSQNNQNGADWSKQIQNIESITSEVQCWCVIDTVKSNAEVDCPVDMWYNGDGGGVSVVQ